MWQDIVLKGLGHAVQDFLLTHQLAQLIGNARLFRVAHIIQNADSGLQQIQGDRNHALFGHACTAWRNIASAPAWARTMAIASGS